MEKEALRSLFFLNKTLNTFMLFEKKYANYLTVYKIPVGPGQLDPTVFYYSYEDYAHRLLPTIHAQIIADLEFFADKQDYRIKHAYIVGSSVNPSSKSKKGDIRVIVEINANLKDIDVDGLASERVITTLKQLSSKIAHGTARKIVYTPTIRPVEKDSYIAIYDVVQNTWIKEPQGIQ